MEAPEEDEELKPNEVKKTKSGAEYLLGYEGNFLMEQNILHHSPTMINDYLQSIASCEDIIKKEEIDEDYMTIEHNDGSSDKKKAKRDVDTDVPTTTQCQESPSFETTTVTFDTLTTEREPNALVTEPHSTKVFSNEKIVPRTCTPKYRKDEVNKYDIGLFYDCVAVMSDEEKFDLIKHVWKPSVSYQFEITNNRKFCYEWLNIFPHLCYSKYLDGAFCLPCVLFGRLSLKKSPLKNLFTAPLTVWSNARMKLNGHFGYIDINDRYVEGKSFIHKESVAFCNNFIISMSEKIASVNLQRAVVIRRNRESLMSFVESIIFLGRQNLPVRGDADEARPQQDTNLMQNLLLFRNLKQQHLDTSVENANNISLPVQNDLIQACANVINRKLIPTFQNSSYFSVLIHDVHERVSLLIRYMDEKNNIHETFVKCISYETSITASAMKDKILDEVRDLGLNMHNCIGQGYCGAGMMAEKHKEAVALIKEEFKFASHVYYGSHCFNLFVQSTCHVQTVRNLMPSIRQISKFFHSSPLRRQCLLNNIDITASDFLRKKLRDLCSTNWEETVDCMDVFQELLPSIISAFEEMTVNSEQSYSNEVSAKANISLNLISSFEFLCTLVVTRNILNYSRGAAEKIQADESDVIGGYEFVKVLRNTIKYVLSNVDTKHDEWYKEVMDLAKVLEVPENLSRSAKSFISVCSSLSVETPVLYAKKCISIPLLNHILTSLNDGFTHDIDLCVQGFNIIPSLMVNGKNDYKRTFTDFAQLFKVFMPSIGSLKAELENWYIFWSQHYSGTFPETITNTLDFADNKIFPNIYTGLRILAIMPIIRCKHEKSLSVLRRLTTYLRSNKGKGLTNGLASLYVHQDILITPNEVIDEFSNISHRIEL